MKIAEGQVEMVGVWLARNANLWHYPSTVIATEFSSIIASGIEIGQLPGHGVVMRHCI